MSVQIRWQIATTTRRILRQDAVAAQKRPALALAAPMPARRHSCGRRAPRPQAAFGSSMIETLSIAGNGLAK